MKLILNKKPKNVTIIEGFPGFGLIGTIATEFLMEHLETEKIGIVEMEEIPAMIAIHDNKVIEPISFHYNKKHNVVLVHAINVGKNLGWKLADIISQLAKDLSAKEIISLEGVGSPNAEQGRIFYYSTKGNDVAKRLKGIANPLNEGIIVGATSALLLKTKRKINAFFADTHSQLPDSNAAAKLIELLDSYLNLKVDPKPLYETAKKFEEKLKGIMEQGGKTQEEVKKKQMSYVG